MSAQMETIRKERVQQPVITTPRGIVLPLTHNALGGGGTSHIYDHNENLIATVYDEDTALILIEAITKYVLSPHSF